MARNFNNILRWDNSTTWLTMLVMPNKTASSEHEKLQTLLRTVRREAGLSQVDLSLRLGRPQSFVSKYESGERRLDILELHEVCRAVGIPLAEFVRRFEDRDE